MLHNAEYLEKKDEAKERTANKSYKTYAVLGVLKVCAIKFRLQRGTRM